MNILNESVKQTTLDEFNSNESFFDEKAFSNSENESFFDVKAFLESEEGKYISQARNKFIIQNDIDDFGFYDTLEDAIRARDILLLNNWDVTKIPESLFSWRFFTEYNPLTHSWEISNLIGDDIVSFGLFKSKDFAKKALKILIENGWNSSAVPLDYYWEDSNIRPFTRFGDTFYSVVRRINFNVVTIDSFENKSEAMEFRNHLLLNNWNLEEEEQQFDKYIFIKGDEYTVKNEGVVYGVFDKICDASDFVIECVKNNWWNNEAYFT